MDAQGAYAPTPLLRRLWRGLLHEADLVTASLQHVLDEAPDALGTSLKGDVRVVPNGVDPAEIVELLCTPPATTVAAARVTTRDFDWQVVTDAYLGCDAAATTRRSA